MVVPVVILTCLVEGHEVFEDHKNTLVDLQVRLQNVSNY